MDGGFIGYRRRLNLLSALLFVGIGSTAAFLGFLLFGTEGAVSAVAAALILGFGRPDGPLRLPGTQALAPWQAPGLFTLVEALAVRAGLSRVPEVRLVPGGQTNAAALLRGRTPVLVVTEALLVRLSGRELGAVLAHETAHLAHRDLWLFRAAQAFQLITAFLGALILFLSVFTVGLAPGETLFWALSAAGAPVLARWLTAALSRTREFAADLGAARLTGDPSALADALARIEYRPRTWWDWVLGRRSPVPTDPASDAFRTHPPTQERIRRLDLMAGRW